MKHLPKLSSSRFIGTLTLADAQTALAESCGRVTVVNMN